MSTGTDRQVWAPWWFRGRSRRQLQQLQRHGLTEKDARLFVALCKAGRSTPEWLADRLIAAANAARAAGETKVE